MKINIAFLCYVLYSVTDETRNAGILIRLDSNDAVIIRETLSHEGVSLIFPVSEIIRPPEI